MKRILIPILLVLLAVMLVSGCNNGCGDDCNCNAVQSENTPTEAPTVTDTPTPVPVTDEPAENSPTKVELYWKDTFYITYPKMTFLFFSSETTNIRENMVFSERYYNTLYLCTLSERGELDLYVTAIPSGLDADIINKKKVRDAMLEEYQTYPYFVDSLSLTYVKPFSKRVSTVDMNRIEKLISEIEKIENDVTNETIDDPQKDVQRDYLCVFQTVVQDMKATYSFNHVRYNSKYSTEDTPNNELADIIISYFPDIITVAKVDENNNVVLPQ